MLIVKMGGLTLICMIHAIILDIPVKDQKAFKDTMSIKLKRQSRLNEDEMVIQNHADFEKRKALAFKEMDDKYEGKI